MNIVLIIMMIIISGLSGFSIGLWFGFWAGEEACIRGLEWRQQLKEPT